MNFKLHRATQFHHQRKVSLPFNRARLQACHLVTVFILYQGSLWSSHHNFSKINVHFNEMTITPDQKNHFRHLHCTVTLRRKSKGTRNRQYIINDSESGDRTTTRHTVKRFLTQPYLDNFIMNICLKTLYAHNIPLKELISNTLMKMMMMQNSIMVSM
jgi:hypothetical protein